MPCVEEVNSCHARRLVAVLLLCGAVGCGVSACGARELAKHPVPCGLERGAIDREIPLEIFNDPMSRDDDLDGSESILNFIRAGPGKKPTISQSSLALPH